MTSWRSHRLTLTCHSRRLQAFRSLRSRSWRRSACKLASSTSRASLTTCGDLVASTTTRASIQASRTSYSSRVCCYNNHSRSRSRTKATIRCEAPRSSWPAIIRLLTHRLATRARYPSSSCETSSSSNNQRTMTSITIMRQTRTRSLLNSSSMRPWPQRRSFSTTLARGLRFRQAVSSMTVAQNDQDSQPPWQKRPNKVSEVTSLS